MIEVSILKSRAFMRLNGTLAYLACGRGRTILHGWTPHTHRKTRLGLSTACHSTGIPAPHARLPDWSPAPTGPCLDAGSDSASGTRRPCHERNGAWCVPCPCLRAIARACARGWKRSLDSPDSIVTTIIVSLHMVVCAVHNTGGQDKAEGEGQS